MTDEKIYTCLLCNKDYSSYMGLWKHKKKKQSEKITSEIIEKYRTDLRINYHELSSNVGAELNAKKALSLANSNLVTYLADDDFLTIIH